jgi:hypothetical protein
MIQSAAPSGRRVKQRVSEEEDVERVFGADADRSALLVHQVFMHVGKVSHIQFERVVRVQ